MKAYFPSTVAFYEEMCVFFLKKRVRKVRETESPEVPLSFGEGFRRSLVNAAGCREAVSFMEYFISSPILGKCWPQGRCFIIFIEQVQFHTIISIVSATL